jgi:hypothetical protein
MHDQDRPMVDNEQDSVPVQGEVLELSAGPLDDDQLQRVEALKEARGVMASANMFGHGGIDNVDGIIRIARYIVTGRDLSYAEDAFRAHEKFKVPSPSEGAEL